MKHTLYALKEKVVLLLTAFISLISPIHGIILVLGLLVISDLIFGVWRAKKVGEKITSRALSATAFKLIRYFGGVLIFFFFEKYMLADLIDILFKIGKDSYIITKSVAVFFALIELLSIKENTEVVFNISYWSSFRKMMTAGKLIKGEIKQLTKDNDKNDTPTP
jgi:hypothetical protein